MGDITIRQVAADETDVLASISRETFFTAFAHLNSLEDMLSYADKAFDKKQIELELLNPQSSFYFAEADGTIAGYLKLNTGATQTEFKGDDSLEVERIYVHADFQGKQIGTQLLDFAIEEARRRNKAYVWLGVWEQNTKALKFYKRNGFVQCGSHDFWLGNDKQTDLLMRFDMA